MQKSDNRISRQFFAILVHLLRVQIDQQICLFDPINPMEMNFHFLEFLFSVVVSSRLISFDIRDKAAPLH